MTSFGEMFSQLLEELVTPDPDKVRMFRSLDRVHATAGWTRHQAWREAYIAGERFIRAVPANRWAFDAYDFVRDGRFFTPIEREFWSVIRINGIVLYPQYPVGRFTVDFGNPVAGVAVECDGAAYHQDHAKEMARDAEIRAEGWEIFHLQGKEIFQEWYPGYHNGLRYDLDEWDDEDEYDDEPTRTVEPWLSGRYDPATSLAMFLSSQYKIGSYRYDGDN
jgi:very-short-patch-repair endonuclease